MTNQEIKTVSVGIFEGEEEVHTLGTNNVTKIVHTTKDGGQYVSIPYITVWKGDEKYAEFCQHNIIGVYFVMEEDAPEETPPEMM